MLNTISINPPVQLEPVIIDGFDLMIDFWIDLIIKYDKPIDATVLQNALERCLYQWPVYAGRKVTLDNGQVIVTKPAGMLLETEKTEEPYTGEYNLLSYQPNRYFCNRQYRFEHKTSLTSLNIPLLQIKLTECPNGAVLGISVWHPIADSVAMFHFLQAVLQTYEGLSAQTITGAAQQDFTAPSSESKSPSAMEPTPEQVTKNLYPRPSEFSTGFDKPYEYIEYQLTHDQVNKLIDLAELHNCQWTDILSSTAWKCLPKADTCVDSERRLHIINSIADLTNDSSPGNKVVIPCLAIDDKDRLTLSQAQIAAKIRHTVTFKTVSAMRELSETRRWMNSYITGHNHNDYVLGLFYDATFGGGLIYNNFSFLQDINLTVGGQGPAAMAFTVDAGPRVFSLLPYGRSSGYWTFTVGLFKDELEQFDRQFTEQLETGLQLKCE